MSTQIQIPNSKVYIIFYPPINCLQNSFFNKIKKNILQIPKLYFAKQILIFYTCIKREQLIPKSKEFDLQSITCWARYNNTMSEKFTQNVSIKKYSHNDKK